MSDITKPDKNGEPMTNAKVSRRRLLAGGAALGGLVAGSTAARAAGTPDPLITEIQDWNRYLGDGVDAHPYGMPSQFESHVIRRDVAWLTADEWQTTHEVAGYTVAGLVAFRLVWGLVGNRYARFTQFLKGPGKTLAYIGDMVRGREQIGRAHV